MSRRHTALEREIARALGGEIRRARMQRDVKQESLAIDLGLKARGTVSNWEAGRRLVTEAQWHLLRGRAGLALPDYQTIRLAATAKYFERVNATSAAPCAA